MRPTGRKPSPRLASVVGQAQIARPGVGEQVELRRRRVRRVDDGRALGRGSPCRASSSIGRQPCSARHSSISRGCSSAWTWSGSPSPLGVAADLLEPVRAGTRARSGGRRRRAIAGRAQRLDLVEVGGDGRLAEAVEPAALVGDVEEHELDARPRRPPPPPRAPRERRGSGTRRRPCSRRRASRGRRLVELRARAPASGAPPRRASPSRQAQKSPPAARPRSARWNAWLCALTKPGSGSVSVTRHAASDHYPVDRMAESSTPVSLRRSGSSRTRSRCCASPRSRSSPGSCLERRRRAELARRDRLRRGRHHRPARRLARAPLAGRVALRQGRRPARRPADDRRGGHARLVDDRLPWIALASSSSATSCSSAATGSSCRAATSSRSRASGRSRPGCSTRRSASCSSPSEGTWWPLVLFWIGPRARGRARRPVPPRQGALRQVGRVVQGDGAGREPRVEASS